MLRILGPLEYRQHVFHVGGLEKLQPTVLDVGNVTANEFDLEPVAVVRTPKQHGLAFQLQPLLATGEYRLDDKFCFGITILDRYVAGFAARRRSGLQALLVMALTVRDQVIRAVEDGLRRTVVLLQRDHTGWR